MSESIFRMNANAADTKKPRKFVVGGKTTTMKRVIKQFASLDETLLELLEEEFPNGVQKKDLVSFPTPQGKRIQGLELRTSEVIYFIRIPNLLALREQGCALKIDYSLKVPEEIPEM